MIDGVISAAGKFQPDCPIGDGITMAWTIFANVLDSGVRRAGSEPGAREGWRGSERPRRAFEAHGARVLAVLSDANAGHGAFHRSPLKLAERALLLMDKALAP